MKQTAVEWLVIQLTDNTGGIYTTDGTSDVTESVKQAIEMEKCQIEDAYIEGLWENPVPFLTNYQAEQYYNENFNSKDKDELQDDWDVTLNDGIED